MDLRDIFNSVQAGDSRRTEDLVVQALRENFPPGDILKQGLTAGMIEMRKKNHKHEVLDLEALIAEWAMKTGLEILMPVFKKGQNAFLGTVITGTLAGDIRETEKDIISCLMRSHGLRVVDLGTSVSNPRFVKAALEEKADIIACNSTLTVFMPQMKSLVQAAGQADIRGKTKILLSGGPVTEWFCKSIDADIYAPGQVQAAEIAAEHCKKLKGA